MAINEIFKTREFYDAIEHFEEDEKAQEYYYQVMDAYTGRKNADGSDETNRDRILKAYAILFCEDMELSRGARADVDDVANTADRLYIGSVGYDPGHWYRMKHHFPIIDDDNYDRFAALVIADMNSGPLHETALNDGETLLVGEMDPLHMTDSKRKSQKVHKVTIPDGGVG